MKVADYTPARHKVLSDLFPGERLVIPAGDLRSDQTTPITLPRPFGVRPPHGPWRRRRARRRARAQSRRRWSRGHTVLPPARPAPHKFYADARHGEFWVGARLSAEEMQTATGLKIAHIDGMKDAISKDLGEVQISVIPQSDAAVESMVAELRQQNGLTEGAAQADARLARPPPKCA